MASRHFFPGQFTPTGKLGDFPIEDYFFGRRRQVGHFLNDGNVKFVFIK
jgi:hypothetical protein